MKLYSIINKEINTAHWWNGIDTTKLKYIVSSATLYTTNPQQGCLGIETMPTH